MQEGPVICNAAEQFLRQHVGERVPVVGDPYRIGRGFYRARVAGIPDECPRLYDAVKKMGASIGDFYEGYVISYRMACE